MPKLRNGSKGDSNPGSLDCASGILSLSYRAPVVWCPCTSASCTSPFLFHIGTISCRPILHSFGTAFPSSCIHVRAVAFLPTWLPPLQPSPLSLAALHLPLSPCLCILCIAIFPLLPVLSPPLPPRLSPNRARELEATFCSFSAQ